MALHEFGHVQPHHGVLTAKVVGGQGLGQLGLAHARGAGEDEGGNGPVGVLQSNPRPADCRDSGMPSNLHSLSAVCLQAVGLAGGCCRMCARVSVTGGLLSSWCHHADNAFSLHTPPPTLNATKQLLL